MAQLTAHYRRVADLRVGDHVLIDPEGIGRVYSHVRKRTKQFSQLGGAWEVTVRRIDNGKRLVEQHAGNQLIEVTDVLG